MICRSSTSIVATISKEEQDEMFPKAKKAKLDLTALGAQILERKQELQASGRVSAAKEKASVA